jgi:hypothetical protein
MRRFSTDVPTSAPIRRKGIIKSRNSASVYLVDVHGSNGSASLAIWEGTNLLDLGQSVTLEFDATLPAWWIVS